jgi:hypothetical protein
VGGDARNEWDVRLNDVVPTDLQVQMGAGESDLDLDSLALTGLDLEMGAGKTTVDLTGDYGQDLDASILGGVGEATVLLPSKVGVRVRAEGGLGKINAQGLQRDGNAYVNDAYGDSDVTSRLTFKAGLGRSTWRLSEAASCMIKRHFRRGIDARSVDTQRPRRPDRPARERRAAYRLLLLLLCACRESTGAPWR